MAKWWTGMALLAICLGGSAPLLAQNAPVDGGLALLPDPVPCAPSIAATAGLQGPHSPGGGAAMFFGSPGQFPNAFDDPACSHQAGDGDACTSRWARRAGCGQCYVTLGSMALRRQKLGHGALAVLDPGNIDTGVLPPATAPLAADLNDVDPDYGWGVRATVGRRWQNHALELSGFYLWENEAASEVINRGRLDTFFFIPPLGSFRFPLGFEGNNFLWLQADRIRTTVKTTLGNGEANCRCWSDACPWLQVITGVRYLDLQDRLAILTDDEGFSVVPDARRAATYSVRAHNRLLGPQLGFETDMQPLPFLWLTAMGKGCWGVNFLDVDVLLERGDGFVGRSGNRSDTIFSHLYEGGLYLDWYFGPNVRVRTGYNALWAVHVAEAVEQLSFDLSQTSGKRRDNGNIFYHGPVIELTLVF